VAPDPHAPVPSGASTIKLDVEDVPSPAPPPDYLDTVTFEDEPFEAPPDPDARQHRPVKVPLTLRHALGLGSHAVLRVADTPRFDLIAERNKLAEQIWDLRKVQGTYSVLGSKGGLGKTPLVSYLSALLQLYTPGFPIVVIDTNENEGSTAYRMGVEREDTILLTQVLSELDFYLEHPNLLHSRIGRHSPGGRSSRTGLGVLPNVDFVSQDNQQRRHVLERGMVVARLVFGSVFCDPGNAIRGFASIVPARASDVVLIPALANDEETFDRILNLVRFLEAHDDHLGPTIRQRGFVVVLGTKPKHVEHYADVLGWNPERIFTVPFDYHMTIRGKGNVDTEMIRLQTQIALMRLLVAMLSHERNDYLNVLSDTHQLPSPVVTEEQVDNPVTQEGI
jgi:cellulose biosynthesis protein BcsQ